MPFATTSVSEIDDQKKYSSTHNPFDMDFDLALEAALNGDAFMFVGAGFSTGATNLLGKDFLRGKELAELLAKAVNLPDDTPLNEAAEVYLDEVGADKLIELLQNEFTASEVSKTHRNLAKIPWRKIYTTNYDNVVERSCEMEGVRCTPITTSVNIRDVPKDHMLCVHLNGYIQSLGREALQNELKLTDASYLTASLTNSPWMSNLREDMRYSRAIFFVGYSLYDVDIKKLLVESDALKEKCFFILPNPSVLLKKRVERFGTIVAQNTVEFARNIKKKLATYVPVEKDKFTTLSLRDWTAINPNIKSTSITDKDFLNLLLFGNFQEACINESLRANKTYYLSRGLTKKVTDLLKSNKVVAVCSDLGNGKTLFLRGLIRNALHDGYRVFETFENSEATTAELRAVASLKQNTLIIIDGYQNWLEEIKVLFHNASDNIRLVVATRSSTHEVVVDKLCEATGLSSVQDVRLDILKQNEAEWFIKALNEYGIWGDIAGKSAAEKMRFVTVKCHSQIHALLLKVLSSPDIHNKLRSLSDSLSVNAGIYNIITSIFVFAAINSVATLDKLTDIWGLDVMGSSRFRNDSSVRQLIDFSLDHVSVRSATAAQYFLSKIIDANVTVSAMITMAGRADTLASTNKRYRALVTELVKFRNLQNIFNEDHRTAALFQFYENVKNLTNTKSNPLFWLQYAIASMAANDLPRAKRYFETAYSLGRSTGWDTFQIDNHFARYLLVHAVENLRVEDAMEVFRQARWIINQQIRGEKYYNPYRVAIGYRHFFDRFGSNLSIQNVQEIGEAAALVAEKSYKLPMSVQTNRYVIDCRKAMEYVASKVAEREKRPRPAI